MSNGSMQCGWCGSCLGHKGFGTADCEQRQSIVTLPTQSSSGDDEMSDDNRYSNHFVNESSGGDKGAMSDDQDIRRGYREHMRKIQGLPSQEPDPTPDNKPYPTGVPIEKIKKAISDPFGTPTPDPIAFEQVVADSLKSVGLEMTDVTSSPYADYKKAILAAHNQSLQTAVVEALEGLVSAYDKKYQKIGAEHGVVRETPHTVFHELIEEAITKAKDTNPNEQ